MTSKKDTIAETFRGNPEGDRFIMKSAQLIMRLFGWRVVGIFPDVPKFVTIGAPHTSGWDLPLGIGIIAAFGVKVCWMAKDSLFRPPLGWLLRALGGLPIDRNARHNVVDQIVQQFKKHDQFILGLTPEGTRRRVKYWKTGFYYIAYKANVPIVLGFFDYRRKICGIGPSIMPSGDIEADIAIIKDFYADITAKHPEKFGEIKVAKREK
ncbi:MAG: glycerol acyltransferase [Phycisphaerae bacterium]|nr:glycerol acyltransferase [Phycisphaerae bacterium]NIX28374.1 glycerol acyltransferase [Phycisphaerae bacterium]